MGVKILSPLLAGALLWAVQVSGYAETYRGAVVEYHPLKGTTQEDAVTRNVGEYVKLMQEAKSKKAEIIVFPEGGLLTSVYAEVPDPIDDIIPCDNENFQTSKAVKSLSCASKNNKIYSVVNLLEKRKCEPDDSNCTDGYYKYNTNVVFDRRGAVIARYSKFNLYDEMKTQHTKDPEIVFFDTDFGVRFGTFTCFDILFQTPTLQLVQQFQITDFVFTTYWFSELPFLTALQVQQGWAETNNVNLLASGVNRVNEGSTGSGIFNGKYGPLVDIFTESQTSKLLIANIPKIKITNSVDVSRRNASHTFKTPETTPAVVDPDTTADATSDLFLKRDQIYLFNSEVIETGKPFQQTICSSKNFCCDFYVHVDAVNLKAKNYTYRALVHNGVRRFGLSFRGGVQACGVVVCDGPEITNCTSRVQSIPGLFYFKEIRIKGNFKLRNSLQMPSTLTDGDRLHPLTSNKYEFRKRKGTDSMEVSLELLWPVINLHTFAIWGRDFTRDNEPEFPVAGGPFVTSTPCLLVSILAFVLFVR